MMTKMQLVDKISEQLIKKTNFYNPSNIIEIRKIGVKSMFLTKEYYFLVVKNPGLFGEGIDEEVARRLNIPFEEYQNMLITFDIKNIQTNLWFDKIENAEKAQEWANSVILCQTLVGVQ